MKNNYLKIIFLSFVCLTIFSFNQESFNRQIFDLYRMHLLFKELKKNAQITNDKSLNQNMDDESLDLSFRTNEDIYSNELDAHQRAVLDYLIKAEEGCYNAYRVTKVNLGDQGSIDRAHPLCRELRDVRWRFVRYYARLHRKSPGEVLQSLNS